MKIEIVSSMSFDEYNERLYYESFKDEKKELSRRQFIKFLAVGSAGLLLPIYTPKEANAAIPLIIIFYMGVLAAGFYKGLKEVKSDDDVKCELELRNEGKKEDKSQLNCRIHDDKEDLYVYEKQKKSPAIPPKTIANAKIIAPPIQDTGKFTVAVKNEQNEKKDKIIIKS